MSFRRHVHNQYQVFTQTLHTILFPEWFTSFKFRVALLGLLVVVSILYVLQVSAAVVSGYQIEQWENKIKSLVDQEQQLTIEIADFSSISHIEKRLSELSMIPASQIKYVQQTEGGMVAKK